CARGGRRDAVSDGANPPCEHRVRSPVPGQGRLPDLPNRVRALSFGSGVPMPSWLRFAPLAILTMCLLPSSAAAATAPSTPTLPDTGLFASVAAQFKARSDQLLRSERQPVTPERLRLLLATGRPDEAAKLSGQATGDPRELAVARARVMLVRQDFAA